MSERRGSLPLALLATILAGVVAGCGAKVDTRSQPEPASVFSTDVTRVELEVDYAEGAAPYTGAAGGLDDIWQLAETNLEALFAGAPKEVIVPNTLAAMEQIDAPAGPYRGTDLVEIAAAHRDQLSHGSTVTFYAVWLNGYYSGVDGEDRAVLGAALPDYGLIAIFKPVITGSVLTAPNVAPFTEQSALVHELGHTLGLVNAGIPEASAHEDTDHPGHCDNPRCVMYWSNEGGSALARFATELLQTGSTVLFDDACLGDAKAEAEH